MIYEIKQLNSPNFESRQGYVPILQVVHITDGQDSAATTEEHEHSAVYNTFMSPASQCSCHHEILISGEIEQFVDIQNDAWTQGLPMDKIPNAPSPIVRNMNVNPNLYSLSVELEAFKDHGGDGNISEAQFWSLCWLLKYNQSEVQRIYGHKMPLNSTYVIGHCHIDPVNRPFDPGPKFPWARLFTELAIADNMTMQDYEGRLVYLGSPKAKASQAYAIGNEITYLWDMSKGTNGDAQWAKNVLLGLHPVMTSLGLLTKPYSVDTSHDDVANQALFLYNTGQGKDGDGVWAREQLLKLYPYMLTNGLV